eukprot:COSAG01_NODE_38114_length_494_cov_0.789873_1_plen_34_part_10
MLRALRDASEAEALALSAERPLPSSTPVQPTFRS